MSRLSRWTYKPVGVLAGAAAGMVAGMLFKQTWRLVAGEDSAPQARDEDRGWVEVLAAAAVQGAIFSLVKAAVDRGGATAVRRVTGEWPD